MDARILSVNISSGGIPKRGMPSVCVTAVGLDGDGHDHEKHRTPLQAVCLQDIEKLEELNQEGYALSAGSTGENLTVRGLNVNALPVGAVLRCANGVVLQLTKTRKPCYVLDRIDPCLKEDIAGRCGMYAKVIQEGVLSAGESIAIVE